MNSIPFKNQILSLIYFGLSMLITWVFVAIAPVYISREQQLLSTAIAGGKWMIQIAGALLFLGQKRWLFIRNIGSVCFAGSCLLIPYILLSYLNISNSATFFTGSLIIAVITMIFLYFRAVQNSGIPRRWWWWWLLCLAVAVSLQLTVVFHLINY